MHLSHLREMAEAHLHSNNKARIQLRGLFDVCITVPTYFNDSQREAVRFAAKTAGFTRIRLINEPIAASASFLYEMKQNKNILNSKQKDSTLNSPLNCLIIDIGASHIEASVCNIDVNSNRISLLSTSGNTHCGGDDIDNNLAIHFSNQYKQHYNGKSISQDKRIQLKLRHQCEEAKRVLSKNTTTIISIDHDPYSKSKSSPDQFTLTITRSKLEELNARFFTTVTTHLKRCLDQAKLTKLQINKVLLLGGMANMPKLQNIVNNFFDNRINIQTKFSHFDVNVVNSFGGALIASSLTEANKQLDVNINS
jgi:heat shock 70kDa protein 1/2/6/8